VNHIKVFMQDVRDEGIVYAVQAVVEWLDASLNPYTQLREAQAWAADFRVVIDELSEENVQLAEKVEWLERHASYDEGTIAFAKQRAAYAKRALRKAIDLMSEEQLAALMSDDEGTVPNDAED